MNSMFPSLRRVASPYYSYVAGGFPAAVASARAAHDGEAAGLRPRLCYDDGALDCFAMVEGCEPKRERVGNGHVTTEVGSFGIANGAPVIRRAESGLAGEFTVEHEGIHVWQRYIDKDPCETRWGVARRILRTATMTLSRSRNPDGIPLSYWLYVHSPMEMDVHAAFAKRAYACSEHKIPATLDEGKGVIAWFMAAPRFFDKPSFFHLAAEKVRMINIFDAAATTELARRVLRVL